MATLRYNYQIPKKLEPILTWDKRYIALTGGRGGSKSHSVVRIILDKQLDKRLDVLVCREHQNSLEESSYKLFSQIIDKYNLPYKKLNNKLISLINGSEIVFIGLSDLTAENVKSYESFTFCWLEEAQNISKKSWQTLNPTLRMPNTQIIISMNPNCPHEKHPIMSELTTFYADKTLHIHINYYDNPFLDNEVREMAELTKIHKPEEYRLIWEGIADGTGTNNIVKGFSKDNIRTIFYQKELDLHISCDFNYDPMCWVFMHKTQNNLYCFDELIEEHTSTFLCAKKVIERFPDHKGNIILNGDAAGRQHNCMQSNPDMTNFKILQKELENYYKRKVDIEIHKGNPHKIKRFEAFNRLIKDYDGTIRFYISPECKWTIYNIENAKFKEGTNDVDEPTPNKIEKNPELKFLIHPLDAASYPAEYYFPIK